jgi:hypothetical protein
MDPVKRAGDFLRDNRGHMTYSGHPSFDLGTPRWFVPIHCRTARGAVVIGDVELDEQGHIVFAPSRDELLSRLAEAASSAGVP